MDWLPHTSPADIPELITAGSVEYHDPHNGHLSPFGIAFLLILRTAYYDSRPCRLIHNYRRRRQALRPRRNRADIVRRTARYSSTETRRRGAGRAVYSRLLGPHGGSSCWYFSGKYFGGGDGMSCRAIGGEPVRLRSKALFRRRACRISG
jgi:hypothetical protein